MLRTPSTSSSMRRPGSLMEILVAVRIVAQPDRQCQLGKADRRRVALVRWFDLRVRLGLGPDRGYKSLFSKDLQSFIRWNIQATKF
jgi:hypothetical protein